jgi:hypothetical protein
VTTHPTGTCPPEILDWIAWYPDGGLSDAERGAVEAHAAACAPCREEIAVLAGRIESPVAPPDPERLFARVLALVESDELRGEPAPVSSPANRMLPTSLPLRPGRRGDWRQRPAALAAAVALAVLAGGLGWLASGWWTSGSASAPLYHEASSPNASAPSRSVELDVVFRSDVEMERIQTALRGLGAEVRSGPSQLGRYRVELPPGADAAAAAALLRAEDGGVASFAEPVRP